MSNEWTENCWKRDGFCRGLDAIFVVLKLTGNINWSWLWVLPPIWICALLPLRFERFSSPQS